MPSGAASFAFRVPEDMELTGPMKLRLHVELADATDAHLFATVSKQAGHHDVPFEGPFGFGCDVVAKGWLRMPIVASTNLAANRTAPSIRTTTPSRSCPATYLRSTSRYSPRRRSSLEATCCVDGQRASGRHDEAPREGVEPSLALDRPPKI